MGASQSILTRYTHIVVDVYNTSVTAPSNAYDTNFGRFYNHPKFKLEQVARNALNAAHPGMYDFDPNDRFAPKPSITNIISMLDKKFLPPYYAKLVAQYAVEHVDDLALMVKRFGPQVAVGNLKSVVNAPNKAAAIGDEVHNAIDSLCKNPEHRPEFTTTTAAAMYAQYLYFLHQAKPRIVRSEYTVWSYEHGYAGTGDLLWELWGGLWIVDTKTGNQVHPEVGMQTSAISEADVILDANGTESPMPPADVLGVLHVRPRSVKLHTLERREECFKAFLGLKAAFDWRRFHADFVIQEPYRTELKESK